MRKYIDIVMESLNQSQEWPAEHRDYGRMVGKSATGAAVYDRDVEDKKQNPKTLRSTFHSDGRVEHSLRDQGQSGFDGESGTGSDIAKRLHPKHHEVDSRGNSLARSLAHDDQKKQQNVKGGW